MYKKYDKITVIHWTSL